MRVPSFDVNRIDIDWNLFESELIARREKSLRNGTLGKRFCLSINESHETGKQFLHGSIDFHLCNTTDDDWFDWATICTLEMSPLAYGFSLILK